MAVLLLALVATLAWANGSNDNGKGVATLVGYGVASPRRALVYACVTTMLGGIVSFWLAGGMLKGFSGAWLFGGVNLDARFYIAVLIGACGWVLLASRTGMPVSTTHAIIGALCGAGLIAFGRASVQWSALGMRFAVPLAISPLLSLTLVYVAAFPVLWIVSRTAARCACVVQRPSTVAGVEAGAITAAAAIPVLTTGSVEKCAEESPTVMVSGSSAANAIHWLSAGMIGFARGWNDTPKIAALAMIALAGTAHGTAICFAVVLLAMAAGGLIAGRRVLETMSSKLTPLPLAGSLTASLVTATLVGLASWRSLPVSTTHVATGSIIGAGLQHDPAAVRWTKVGEIVLSWLVTLPIAALIAAIVTMVIRR